MHADEIHGNELNSPLPPHAVPSYTGSMIKYVIACFVGILVAVLCPVILVMFQRRLKTIQRDYWGEHADKYEAQSLFDELRELREK
jgi:hypothetical protein